jgi:hypothetical protein
VRICLDLFVKNILLTALQLRDVTCSVLCYLLFDIRSMLFVTR